MHCCCQLVKHASEKVQLRLYAFKAGTQLCCDAAANTILTVS